MPCLLSASLVAAADAERVTDLLALDLVDVTLLVALPTLTLDASTESDCLGESSALILLPKTE